MSIALEASAGGQTADAGARSGFEFRAGPFVQGELNVLSFTGREGISQLFSFEVVFSTTANSRELEAGLIGQPATFVMQVTGGEPRLVHGIVAWLQIEEDWALNDGFRHYRARLVPALWRLKQRVNSRIFQDKTPAEVITSILQEAHIPVRFDLLRPATPYTYCTQYQESDYEFIKRLLAEEGWFFYFEPPSGLMDALGLGAIGSVVGAVGDALGGLAGQASSIAGLTETFVVSDSSDFYPAMASLGDGAAVAVENMALQVASSAGFSVAAAMASGLTNPPPTLPFRRNTEVFPESERSVHKFALRRAMKPTSVTLRDYLYEHPLLDSTARAKLLGGGPAGGLAGASISASVTGANALGAAARGDVNAGGPGPEAIPLPADATQREVYRYQMDHLFGTDAADTRARVELEQHRRKASVAEGASWCRRITAGYRFSLSEHSDSSLNRAYVVTKVNHRGVTLELLTMLGRTGDAAAPPYENTFVCAPANVTMRPKRPLPRAVQVADTAVVVGPADEAIYTDSLGRVKVQFHWDREGKHNEKSSCWLRVLHAWSGPGWGTQFVPRVGMEVLVLYQQGDPDKPIVIGCAPNALTPQPFWLPNDATRSGLRTRSTPGGGGYNELSFEDRAGEEQVLLYAQRNLDVAVGNDHSMRIANDERVIIRGDRTGSIDGDHRESVGGDHAQSISGDRTATVGGHHQVQVTGNSVDTVGGVDHRRIKGSASLSSQKDYTVMVGGAYLTVVGSEEKPTQSHSSTYGKHNLFASDDILIQSEKRIVLRCGESEVTISPDDVRITAKTVVVDGRESTSLYGKKPVLHLTDDVEMLSDKITLAAKSASLELESEAKLLGTKVKLGSGDGSSAPSKDSTQLDTKLFAMQMCDSQFKPYANKPYTLNVQGKRFSGTTSGQGFVRVLVPASASTADLAVWVTPPPRGIRARFAVTIEDNPPPPTDVRGAQLRLRNLGYFSGDADGDMSDGLQDAVRAFQRDHDLPCTGEIDGATAGKLSDLHGH